ncbi:hypothetical protein BDV37DRAFT_273913 [Aspergillus pseudonomiae]|uniref:Uncharacterized protein n=1 Tax=Aspergillus pseudonomiae TaxID=1506151 RepID=A0A5N7D4T8_9EURO|nr:uncharacterized protein BDV37DRAFT_273913 [Aspergillus pseudonomiae]KAE8401147.1 hypothetical protein BDV37DRAFT_273913 [Aspergillus pseudonomiae]
MTNGQIASRRGGSWTKVAIFISLYVLLLESVIEWALVLYLYGNGRVDRKMTPSLILALVASFLTVPLVVLHSLLAWQYNKVPGFGGQKTMLRAACTYLLRVTVIIWLAASVAGLVVISQQASCLPETAKGSFWNTGVSCALHRAAVINLAYVEEKEGVASAPVDSETRRPPNSQAPPTSTQTRPTSSNSSDAPEVVLPAPFKVQRSNTTHTAPIPRTIHRHRPSYTIVPPNPLAWHPVNRVASHRASVVEPDNHMRHNRGPKERRQSRHYQFEQSHVPRHTRSYHQPHSRYNYRGRYEPRRMSSQSRRSDIEIHYPSTRRPRSTTCGGLGPAGALDSIRESGASVDETRDIIPNANTYRGAHRTSMAAL